MSGRRPRAEALGRNDLTMSPPELTERVRGLHARALAGEPVMFEARARRKNGERFDIETRGVVGTRRPAARALHRTRHHRARAPRSSCASEEQYRAIFNAAADALVLRDAEFRIVDVNPAYEGDERRPRRGDRTGPPWSPIRRRRSSIRALHARALAGETVIHETVRVSKNGKRRDVELRGVPIQYRGKPRALHRARHQREEARRGGCAGEEQYRAIFNAAADARTARLRRAHRRRQPGDAGDERLYARRGDQRDRWCSRAPSSRSSRAKCSSA